MHMPFSFIVFLVKLYSFASHLPTLIQGCSIHGIQCVQWSHGIRLGWNQPGHSSSSGQEERQARWLGCGKPSGLQVQSFHPKLCAVVWWPYPSPSWWWHLHHQPGSTHPPWVMDVRRKQWPTGQVSLHWEQSQGEKPCVQEDSADWVLGTGGIWQILV